VTLLLAGLIVVVVAAVAITAMLLVRRRAPDGSYFQDGDRAAGVFGVLATGFAVMIGFVVFLAFESYDTARSGSDAESRLITQMFETAQFLPVSVRGPLSGQLVCYARSVVHQEWPLLDEGRRGEEVNIWGAAMFETMQGLEPTRTSEQTAYAAWFDQRSDRENARADRTHGAEGVIPTPLWIVLFVSATLIFVFMLFFADSGEGVLVQATMMGSIAIVVTSSILLLWFLDNPFHPGPGGLRPVAMERTLTQLKEAERYVGGVTPPCDVYGIRRG
jgi:ABC-type multidrug transport system fused ATPase/permease subunit